MDDLPPDLDRFFSSSSSSILLEDDPPLDSEIENHFIGGTLLSCSKCRHIFNADIPLICECGEVKPYWKTINGRILNIRNMDLGHLSNSIRYLAAKAEEYPASLRERFEIALDILYAELGARDKEIQQAAGIQAALFRKL